MTRYVIIGGSAGAVGAVEAIREVDPTGDILVIDEEQNIAYSRPMMVKYLSREANLEQMLFPTKDFWEKHRVQLYLGKKAVKLDLLQKTVELESTERIGFDKLLIATGSMPSIPNVEGINKKGVYTFTRLTDALRIKEAITFNKAQKAVIVGVGLIGISVAEALAKLGLKVTIVGRRDRILNQILDHKASEILEAAMKRKGVSIVKGRTVQRVLGKKDNGDFVGAVVLDDGSSIECDIVVFAIGVAPRTELASQAGLKVNRGILTDKCMQTNLPDVYACGDVVEAYDFVHGTNRVLALWPLARIGGRVAGYNMAGHKCEYPGGTAMSALHYFDVPIISAGLTVSDKTEGYETLIFNNQEANVYRKVVLKDGKIVGITLVGDVENAGVLFNLMKNQIDVEGFKDALITGNFSLVSLPETLRNQLLLGIC
jgi:NAD(P)H-nitrite reductase large subunit